MLETIAEALRATIAVGLVLAGILAILTGVKEPHKKTERTEALYSDSGFDRDFCVLFFWPLPWNLILSGLIFSIALRRSKRRTCRQTNLQIQKLVKRRGIRESDGKRSRKRNKVYS